MTPKVLVVKLGTTSLTGSDGAPDKTRMRTITNQVAALASKGVKTVVVSSGAIAAGMQALSITRRPTDMPTLQAAAAVGQRRLMDLYADLFASRGLTVGQVLLTQHDIVQRSHYLNARHTLNRLMELGCIPIVNENDTVGVEEIRYGDNDRLAVLVANIVGADLLAFLSDVEGLFDADPNRDAKGGQAPRLISDVDQITPGMIRSARGASRQGSGGMISKLEAARMATMSGIPVVIASAKRKNALLNVWEGKPEGTRFKPSRSRMASRKSWIAWAPASRGKVLVDAGAAAAVTSGGKSLLAAGVTGVKGAFSAGDAVEVAGPDGTVLAKGLVSFDSQVVDEIAGTKGGREVIHRDRMVLL